jgi:Putative transmembrane protein (Alph_Pro_TM)
MKPPALFASALMLSASMALAAAGNCAVPSGSIAVNPRRVGVDLFYSGAALEVLVVIPAGYQAAVRLAGHPVPLELKKLGRKAGLLWMKVEDVTLDAFPTAYQVLSSAPLNDLGPRSELAQWRLGYEALIPIHAPAAALLSEIVGLKEREGLFAIHQGALQRVGGLSQSNHAARDDAEQEGAPQLLRGTFHLPARAPEGDYSIDLIGFKDTNAVELGSTTLHVEYVGTAKALRLLAIGHGLVYGIGASFFAIVVGILTGFIFQPKSNEGH